MALQPTSLASFVAARATPNKETRFSLAIRGLTYEFGQLCTRFGGGGGNDPLTNAPCYPENLSRQIDIEPYGAVLGLAHAVARLSTEIQVASGSRIGLLDPADKTKIDDAITKVQDDPTPRLGGSSLNIGISYAIEHDNGPLLLFIPVADAVNYITLENSPTGFGPILSVDGDDADISLNITTKGGGALVVTAAGMLFAGSSNIDFVSDAKIQFNAVSDITFDSTGDVAFSADDITMFAADDITLFATDDVTIEADTIEWTRGGTRKAFFNYSGSIDPQLVLIGLTTVPNFNANCYSPTASHSPNFGGWRYRGTVASPTTVINGDRLFAFGVAAYDGAALQSTGAMLFVTNGAVSAGNVPTRFDLEVGNSSARVVVLRAISTEVQINNVNLNLGTKNLVTDTVTGTKIGTGTTQKLGFWNATPVAQLPAYTITNDAADRAYDANATTLDELADVVARMYRDMQSAGLFA